MHSMHSVAFFASRQAGGSPAKCSTTNYARLNVNSVAILAVTSISLLANGFATSVWWGIKDIYHCGIFMPKKMFGINCSIIRTLPTMRSIPGKYSVLGKISREHLSLVDFDSARRAGIALHGSVSAMEQYVSSMPAPKAFDGISGNPLRFMAIVRTPWFNKSSQELEWGFHCIACQEEHHSRPLHFRRKFNVGLFKEHLRECGNIQHGRHHLK